MQSHAWTIKFTLATILDKQQFTTREKMNCLENAANGRKKKTFVNN